METALIIGLAVIVVLFIVALFIVFAQAREIQDKDDALELAVEELEDLRDKLARVTAKRDFWQDKSIRDAEALDLVDGAIRGIEPCSCHADSLTVPFLTQAASSETERQQNELDAHAIGDALMLQLLGRRDG